MKALILLVATNLALLSSCKQQISNEPFLQVAETNPLQLKITNFNWSYSHYDKSIKGDFNNLDSLVFNLLNAREGFCEVYLENTNNRNELNIGTLNITLLKNSPNWKNWHIDRGIANMVKHYFARLDQIYSDSTAIKVDTIRKSFQTSSDSNTKEPIKFADTTQKVNPQPGDTIKKK